MHPKINCYGLASRNAALRYIRTQGKYSPTWHPVPVASTGQLIVCQIARGYAPVILHPFVIPVALVKRRRVG